jgi:predicted amidohydrolase
MTPFAIAGVQMHVTTHSNIDAMRHRLDLLMHLYPWVQMVLFSELACYGPLLQNAQPLPGAAEETFQEMAARHRIWLVNGSMYERRDGVIHNTTSVIDPQGKIVGRYRKMFPFLPLEQGVAPGTEFLTFDVPEVGKFGVLNCYDIWFPEVARTLTAMERKVLLHPVLTHTIDRDIDPRRRPRHRRDVPVPRLRHQRAGRRRQRPFGGVRSRRPRALPRRRARAVHPH